MTVLAKGGCRCDTNPVRFSYNKAPAEVHYCLCTDCTDISGGAVALIAVVERSAFTITQGEDKIANYDTKQPATAASAKIAAVTCSSMWMLSPITC